MSSHLTPEKRARRYLQASRDAGYTNLPAEHREAHEAQMRAHERAYPGVREHALAGADRDFDQALTPGEREHQTHLREREGLQQKDVERIRGELRNPAKRTAKRKPATRRDRVREGAAPGARAGRKAAGAGASALSSLSGGGSTFMYAIGVMLFLSIVYLLIAGKGAGALTGIVGVVTGAVHSFVAPVDPIKSLETALKAAPVPAAVGELAAGTIATGATGAVPVGVAPVAAGAVALSPKIAAAQAIRRGAGNLRSNLERFEGRRLTSKEIQELGIYEHGLPTVKITPSGQLHG